MYGEIKQRKDRERENRWLMGKAGDSFKHLPASPFSVRMENKNQCSYSNVNFMSFIRSTLPSLQRNRVVLFLKAGFTDIMSCDWISILVPRIIPMP